MSAVPASLSLSALYRHSDVKQFEALPLSVPMDRMHPRAHAAIRSLLQARRPLHALVFDHGVDAWRDWILSEVRAAARQRPTPPDVVLVHDFTQPNSGYYLTLQPGEGPAFRNAVRDLVLTIRQELPLLFDGHVYQQRVQQLEDGLKMRQEGLLRPVFALAAEQGVMLEQADNLFILRVRHDEQLLGRQEIMQLAEEAREPLLAKLDGVEQALNGVLVQFPSLQHAHLKAEKALNQEVASTLLDPLVLRMAEGFGKDASVAEYLQELKTYVLARLPEFWSVDESATPVSSSAVVGMDKSWLTVFEVQVMCSHAPGAGAPVVMDPALTLARFLGTVAGPGGAGSESVVSTLSVRPGLMHAARGGFLLLPVESLLQEPGLWALLKGMLRGGTLSGSDWRAMQPAMLWGGGFDLPDWPCDLQVLVMGEADWMYALAEADPDVGQLFRTHVEFEAFAVRTPEMEQALAVLLMERAQASSSLPVAPDALAALVEQAARLGEDATRLALAVETLEDVLLRAEEVTLLRGRTLVDREAVLAAVAADRFEAGRLEAEYRHAIAAGWLNIVTEGQAVGQINGLTVYEVGRLAFGQPVKITAQASPGNDGLVDIEKEVELAGPIHSKGMLIVQGYLRGRFMRSRTMALTASVVMEQTYEGVEGDSASAAETLALLSAIARLPLRQDIAVTGAINQFGEVQAVGGINEKIEGFFRLCAMRGLTGQQGVVIPQVNRQSLMLAQEVRDACAAGNFHIWPVQHLDEALRLLTGLEAGSELDGGGFTPDSANALVLCALEQMNPVEHDGDHAG